MMVTPWLNSPFGLRALTTAEQRADHHRNRERRQHQIQRCRNALGDQAGHGGIEIIGIAEVAGGDAAEIGEELFEQALVEAVFDPQCSDDVGRRTAHLARDH